MVTPRPTVCDADVCIVGAGPVGLTLATILLSRGLSVVVLESGGSDAPFDHAAFDDALDGTVEGHGWEPLWMSRSRGVGGTSRIWNTVVADARVAKYALFDPLDFEPRDGVLHTGWPFSAAELAPFLERASATCGLAEGMWGLATDAADRVGPLARRLYAFGPRERFTRDLHEKLVGDPRGRLLQGATAIGFDSADRGRRIEAVRWTSHRSEGSSEDDATTGTVQASRVVLAAGALENTRLLLTAAAERQTPWSDAFWLGRGFMEHPVDRSLELVTRAPILCPDPGEFGPHIHPEATGSGWKWSMGRLALDPDLLREGGLPNASLRFTTQETSPAVLDAPVARSWARRLVPGSGLRRRVGDLVRASARQVRRFRGLRYRLRVDMEQWPDPENRVTLTDRLDGYGRPRLALHWRWSGDDEARRLRVVDLFAAGLDQAGLGRIERTTEHALDPNAHHHAGTTRMSAAPSDGVVDPDLRVHGTDNLFVCGSSVFPTAGAVNPTLSVLALAHRLADHLRSPLASSRHPSGSDAASAEARGG